MLLRLKSILIKEFIQLLRDPKMIMVLFGLPLIQLLIFAFALTTDVKNISMGIIDRDNSVASRELISHFSHSEYFNIKQFIDSDKEIDNLIDKSELKCVLVIKHGLQQSINRGQSESVQLILDGTDATTSSVVLTYVNTIVNRFNLHRQKKVLVQLNGTEQLPYTTITARAWFNPNFKSSLFYLPGMIALMVTVITPMLTALAVVREKELGNIEQIMVTPIQPIELILGKTIPIGCMGLFVFTLMFVVAHFIFGIPIKIDLLCMYSGAVFFLLSTLSAGLLISTTSSTQQQAMLTTLLYILPIVMLSGYVFPIANMPVVIQWLTIINPLRYFIVINRGVILKGNSFDVLWPELLALIVLGTATVILATSKFKKTLE